MPKTKITNTLVRELIMTVRFAVDELKRVHAAADKRGLTASALVRMAVLQLLDADDVANARPTKR